MVDGDQKQISQRRRRMTEQVEVKNERGILTLTLKRPDKKNALTNEMYAPFADVTEAPERDPAVRVVLIRGEGDSFSAGNDLGEFAAVAAGKATGERHVTRFIHSLGRATKPLVAAVHGRAVGIGTTMLLHGDLVGLADNALLPTPFIGLALVPEAASSIRLSLRIGHARA